MWSLLVTIQNKSAYQTSLSDTLDIRPIKDIPYLAYQRFISFASFSQLSQTSLECLQFAASACAQSLYFHLGD